MIQDVIIIAERRFSKIVSFHYISFRTFVHATEDRGKVAEAMAFASGVDELTEEAATGYHGNPISILYTQLKRRDDIINFFSRISLNDLEELIKTLENRVDEECNFYLRLSKQAAARGLLRLADDDDIIHVMCKIETYPRKREKAISVVKEFLNSIRQNSQHR